MLKGYVDKDPWYTFTTEQVPEYLPTGYATEWGGRRLAWCVATCVDFLDVHPEERRVMSHGEVWKTLGFDSPLNDNNPRTYVSHNCLEWLNLQIELFEQDYWGPKDWESTFDPAGKWVGKTTPNAKVKTFDMRRYFPRVFDRKAHENIPRIPHKAKVCDAKLQKLIIQSGRRG
jgi:hypothetical protein